MPTLAPINAAIIAKLQPLLPPSFPTLYPPKVLIDWLSQVRNNLNQELIRKFFFHKLRRLLRGGQHTYSPQLQKTLVQIFTWCTGYYHYQSVDTTSSFTAALDLDVTIKSGQKALIEQARIGNPSAKALLYGQYQQYCQPDNNALLLNSCIDYLFPDVHDSACLSALINLASYENLHAQAQLEKATAADIDALPVSKQEDYYECFDSHTAFIWRHAFAKGRSAQTYLTDYYTPYDFDEEDVEGEDTELHTSRQITAPVLLISHLEQIVQQYRQALIFWPTSSNMRQVIVILAAAKRQGTKWLSQALQQQLTHLHWKTEGLTSSHIAQSELESFLNPNTFCQSLALLRHENPETYASYITWLMAETDHPRFSRIALFSNTTLTAELCTLVQDCFIASQQSKQTRSLLEVFIHLAVRQNQVHLIPTMLESSLSTAKGTKQNHREHCRLLLKIASQYLNNTALLCCVTKQLHRLLGPSNYHQETCALARYIAENGTAQEQKQGFQVLYQVVKKVSQDCSPYAWFNALAQCYASGWGCDKDPGRAQEIWGYNRAQGSLATLTITHPNAQAATLLSMAKQGDMAAYLQLKEMHTHHPLLTLEAQIHDCSQQYTKRRLTDEIHTSSTTNPANSFSWQQRQCMRIFDQSAERFTLKNLAFYLMQIGRSTFTCRWHGRDVSTEGANYTDTLTLTQDFIRCFPSCLLTPLQVPLWKAAKQGFIANTHHRGTITPDTLQQSFNHHHAFHIPNCGWLGHSIGINLLHVGSYYYLSYENRGEGSHQQSGTHFFEIQQVSKLTHPDELNQWLRKLRQKDFVTDWSVDGQGIGHTLQLKPIAYIQQSNQKSGNCTVTASNNAMMLQLLSHQLHHMTITTPLSQKEISMAMTTVRPIYKTWRLISKAEAIKRFCALGIQQKNGTYIDADEHAKLLTAILDYIFDKYPSDSEQHKQDILSHPVKAWLASTGCPYTNEVKEHYLLRFSTTCLHIAQGAGAGAGAMLPSVEPTTLAPSI